MSARSASTYYPAISVIQSGVGTNAMIMGWFSFSLVSTVKIGILIMSLSTGVLAQINTIEAT